MKLAGFTILFAIVLILGVDLFIVFRDGSYNNTISQWVYVMSKQFMVIPFAAGVVAGHFWWPIMGGKK